MSAVIEFTKMTGAGNDFVVFDNRNGVFPVNSALIQRICQRKFSVGADGVLLLESAGDADFSMRIFNADGSEAEMCGNGARCLARFACDHGIAGKEMKFCTAAGFIKAWISKDDVTLDMGSSSQVEMNITVELDKTSYIIQHIVIGVPHVVVFVKDLQAVDIEDVGRKIRRHRQFQPNGANVNFVKVEGPNHIAVRTYERGVEAETFACGTGVSASAVVSSLVYKIGSPVQALTLSGDVLSVDFSIGKLGRAEEIKLTGPAKTVYKGVIEVM